MYLSGEAYGSQDRADRIHVSRVSHACYAEQVLPVGGMEKHDSAAVAFLDPVGNAGDSVDGNDIVHLGSF